MLNERSKEVIYFANGLKSPKMHNKKQCPPEVNGIEDGHDVSDAVGKVLERGTLLEEGCLRCVQHQVIDAHKNLLQHHFELLGTTAFIQAAATQRNTASVLQPRMVGWWSFTS